MDNAIEFTVSPETRKLFKSDRSEFCTALEEEMLEVMKENVSFFDFDLTENRGTIEEESMYLCDLEINFKGDGKVQYTVWEY